MRIMTLKKMLIVLSAIVVSRSSPKTLRTAELTLKFK